MDSESGKDEIVYEWMPCIRIYKSGRVDRFFGSEFVPADAASSVDAVIDPVSGVSARLYRPPSPSPLEPEGPAPGPRGALRLPILVYYHGGGFCIGSAFNPIFHAYFNALVARARVLVVSVEYRLAPEHPVPGTYADAWRALQWVASHAPSPSTPTPTPTLTLGSGGGGASEWLRELGDFGRVFVGGESAGANIAHHMAMRAGAEGLDRGVAIRGLLLVHPYFLGTEKVDSDAIDPAVSESLASLWRMMCPTTTGSDDPLINPLADGAPPLSGLVCRRALVCVAEKDVLKDRGKQYYRKLQESGWPGEARLREAAGVGHTFHLLGPAGEEALAQDEAISEFLNS
ncbi:tuliposide A-converting enzyme 1, chloroplastic-like [Ananas comosus]|nr:tuliposide A-converting enzyme 1, chloroplastic-like [Ananas comosus]